MSKLRVWHMPQVDGNTTLYIPIKSIEEGKKIMDILACYDLFQFENNIKPDYCNMNGIQMFNEECQEWEDWFLETDNDYYDNVDDYFENNEQIQAFSRELFGQFNRQ